MGLISLLRTISTGPCRSVSSPLPHPTPAQVQAKWALAMAVFKKTLLVGEVDLRPAQSMPDTLMRQDADRVAALSGAVPEIVSASLQILLGAYFLYLQLGWSLAAGLAPVLLIVPVGRLLTVLVQRRSVSMLAARERRLGALKTVLSNIKQLMMLGWEGLAAVRGETDRMHCLARTEDVCLITSRLVGMDIRALARDTAGWPLPICERDSTLPGAVMEPRRTEMKELRARKLLRGCGVFVLTVSSVLLSTVTFITFVVSGGRLTATTVFTSLALFSILIHALDALPWAAAAASEAHVAMGRLGSYLALPETMAAWEDGESRRTSDPYPLRGPLGALEGSTEGRSAEGMSLGSLGAEETPCIVLEEASFMWAGRQSLVSEGAEEAGAEFKGEGACAGIAVAR